MTSIWDSPELTGVLGEQLAEDLREMVRAFDARADRSQQADIGPSEVGNPCTRCLARHALGMRLEREFDDPWCKIIGTAVHSWLDSAAAANNVMAMEQDRPARWYPEQRVHPHPDLLPRGGKADLYDASTFTVIDHKIVGAEPLRKYRRNGPGVTYCAQGHLYGLGYHRLGKRVDNVAVAFWMRGGRLRDLWVWTEPWDVNVAMDALKRWRTIKEQAEAIGPAILPLLPADPDCWDCGGKDVSPEELASITQPNPAGPGPKGTT